MQDALPIVIVAVVVVAGLVGVAALLSSRSAYDHIGRGGLVLDRDPGVVDATSTSGPVRDEEIRQLLAATNARREARGLPPLTLEDVAEQPADPGLRDEVRRFVIARNERRVARGKPPLDVEAEVERRLWSQDG